MIQWLGFLRLLNDQKNGVGDGSLMALMTNEALL
jgi:hypothetical protein